MSWSKLDDRLHENPKIGALSDKAFRLYILSITYSSSRRTRGHLTAIDANTARRLAEAGHEHIDELVRFRAWDKNGDGYDIHDYRQYNPDPEEISAKRSEAGRIGGINSGIARSKRSKSEANAQANTKQTQSTGNPVPVSHTKVPKDSKVKGFVDSANRGMRLANPFDPPEDWLEFAKKERPDIDVDLEVQKFADYWHAVPGLKGRKLDWSATWRNWVRNVHASKNGAAPVKERVWSKAALSGLKS